MKEKERIGRRTEHIGGKMRKNTAVITAVCVLSMTAMAVTAGCQSTAQGEIMSKAVAVKTAGRQAQAVSRTEEASAGQDDIQTEPERSDGQSDTETQLSNVQNEIQSQLNDAQTLSRQDKSQEQSGVEAQDIQTGETVKEPPAGWELTLASEDWGLSFGEPGTQPVGNACSEDLAWYDAYYVGEDGSKVIYLTFDCGYENGNTEPILDALKKHDVQATFFVVGHFLETAPDMVKRMVAEGHAVGNHTYHHLDMPTISDTETFQKEMDDVANLFHEITGAELSPYYRPPQGKCNVENLKMAQSLGYHTIFWSLAYVDWNQDDQPGHEEALDKLTARIHPGAVVLLHNTSSTNGEILDELLTKWEEMGYRFEPLSKLVGE